MLTPFRSEPMLRLRTIRPLARVGEALTRPPVHVDAAGKRAGERQGGSRRRLPTCGSGGSNAKARYAGCACRRICRCGYHRGGAGRHRGGGGLRFSYFGVGVSSGEYYARNTNLSGDDAFKAVLKELTDTVELTDEQLKRFKAGFFTGFIFPNRFGLREHGDEDVDSDSGGDSGLCWVARAVYGADDPRWRLFRAWLLHQAPAWFRGLYIRHGEAFAVWLDDKPAVKAMIRRWMDARLRGVVERRIGAPAVGMFPG